MPEIPQLPPIASQPLSVVLLAHDQADHVEAVLSAWVTYLNSLEREYELILVDDGSRDDTAERARKVAAPDGRYSIVHYSPALGEGAALQRGLANARHPLLFYTLCDPHYQPADLGELLHKRMDPSKPELEIDHVHILTASRGGGRVPWPWRLIGLLWRGFCRVLFAAAPPRLPGWLGWRRHLARGLVRGLFGVRYHDVTCPFRLCRREIFARIPLQSEGPFVHVEILAKANYLGFLMGMEVALPPGHYPPLKLPWDREELRQIRADARRVLRHPDFGGL